MKWDPPNGSVQYSADRKFCIVHANSKDWIAYEMEVTTAKELDVKPTDEEARTVCEDFAREMTALRRSG